MFELRIQIGNLIYNISQFIKPEYWQCVHCGFVDTKEKEVGCWHCRTGEMVYKYNKDW